MKHVRVAGYILLVFAIVVRLSTLFWNNKEQFSYRYWDQYVSLERAFHNSQYRIKDPVGWIPDETLYSYAAGAYIKGISPIDVVPEAPPLGKYLLSLSILVWGNPNVIVGVSFIFFVLGCFFLFQYVTRSLLLSLVTIYLLLWEPLIIDQLRYMPLLDIFLLTFHVWSIIMIILGVRSQKILPVMTCFMLLGFAVMTKIFTVTVPLIVIVSFTIFLYAKFIWWTIPVGYVLMYIISIAAYARIYQSGHTPLDVLRIQKWIFWYHRSKINRFGTIWPLIYLNIWYVWWGNKETIQDPSWTVRWPLAFSGSFLYIIKNLRLFFDTKNVASVVILLWVLCYSVLMSLGQATARYILPLIPYIYLLSVLFLVSVWKTLIQMFRK